MKYWLLTTEYPPQFGGGIGTYVHCTANMLSNRGHDVTVFIYDIGLRTDKVTFEKNIRLVRFVPNRTNTGNFLGFQANISYEYAAVIGEFIRNEGRPDIIESQEYLGIAYYLQQFKWMQYENYADLNILITCHAPSFLYLEYNQVPVYEFPQYWIGEMEKASMHCADILISPSKYLINEIQNRIATGLAHTQYLLNPVTASNHLKSLQWQKNCIICFGKLSPLKGTFSLLSYFKDMWDNGFEHPLYIVGSTSLLFHPEGETMGDIVRKKYRNYIDRRLLILMGEIEPASVNSILERAHLVIVPSLVDNLPYTVLEAMNTGKVILASRQGGQSEIINDGENGFLFDHSTKDDFNQKLKYILSLDHTTINSIGENARQTIREKLAVDVIYNEKIKIINQYVSDKRIMLSYPFSYVKSMPVCADKFVCSGLTLSVIIPYFNMGKYIDECIKSVLKARVAETEIIIVDDGSTEKSSILALEEIEKRYPVKIFRNSNQGLALTRNFGAENASGDFIAFLDPDDTVEQSYYRKAIRLLSIYNNVHFAGCWSNYTGKTTGYWPAFNPEPPLLLFHNVVSSTLVFRRSSFLAHGKNDPNFEYGMEDWDSVISMIENNCGGLVLPEPLFNYRVRKKSMARKFTIAKRLYLHKLIAEKHKAIYKQYSTELTNLFNANGSGLFIDNPSLSGRGIGRGAFGILSGALRGRVKEKIKSNKHLRSVAYKIFKRLKK